MTPQSSLDLGVIGNCSFGALVDKLGRIVWCCLPRFDGDPVFNDLLSGEGVFEIELENFSHAEQVYRQNTAILETRLYDMKGQALEIVDFAPRFPSRGRVFRPNTIIRRVRPLSGRPRVRVLLRPRFEWNAVTPATTRGSNHIRYTSDGLTLRLTTDAPVDFVAGETPFHLDRSLNFVLGPDETLTESPETVARNFEEETERYWRDWVRRLALPFEWQDAVIRAAITLKLCVYEPTGAIIAALTTSIPEAPGSERNWDYRYCWIRDAFFVLRALNSLGAVGTMEHYFRWISNVAGDFVEGASDGHLQPVYGVGLEKTLTEEIVPDLNGYRGMGPVRRGNQAYEHFQHDVYGNVVLAIAQAFFDKRLFRPCGVEEFRWLEAIGERAYQLHNVPDAGMWELRTRARVHTSSSLMCWAACDRLAKIGHHLGMEGRASYWRGRADEIRAVILKEAWNEEQGCFVESFGGGHLDASVLLMGEIGLIDPMDPRFVATVEKIEARLGDGPHMRRYEAPDDFGEPETAFNICTFWRIDALAQIGRVDEARAVFEEILACRNHLGLLSEDLSTKTGELWGNFPQTYSLVGIINAARRLSASWTESV
ncbi:glycoside hydrolase family 15 protein [Tepidicaulis sp.]|uniref:glycoside hydrolase family 15 protein n=1 Tax=Tepidicaulis sp. TaxID=1920809 RepID=UPI003B5B1924